MKVKEAPIQEEPIQEPIQEEQEEEPIQEQTLHLQQEEIPTVPALKSLGDRFSEAVRGLPLSKALLFLTAPPLAQSSAWQA